MYLRDRPRKTASARGPAKVLHVITGLGVGGAERSLVQLLECSRSQLAEVRVVSLTSHGHYYDVIRDMGIPVLSLGIVRGRASLLGLIRLTQEIHRYGPDVVQSWMYHADLLALLALWLSGRRSFTRLLWGIRNTHIARYERRWLLGLTVRLCGLLSRGPDLVVANSWAGRADHVSIGYASERIRVVHNGVQMERFRPDPARRRAGRERLGINESRFVIVTAARCHQMKGYPTLQDALARLPDILGIAAGDGTELLRWPVNLIGVGLRHDIEDLLNVADLYVSSSHYGEGTSNAILEAMACGLPVVATDVGDAAFIVDNAGIIVPANDPAAMAGAVRRIMGDEDLRLQMSRFAVARVATTFRQAICAKNLMALYGGDPGTMTELNGHAHSPEELMAPAR